MTKNLIKQNQIRKKSYTNITMKKTWRKQIIICMDEEIISVRWLCEL
jgi:hypothetical protein